MGTLYPTGKGFFVYDIGRLYNADPMVLVQSAKDQGLDWVSLKVADGDGVFQPKAVAAAAAALQSAGVEVWGWQYVYGHQPTTEAQRAVERVKALGLNGLMIDAETEYDQAGMAPSASVYMAGLKAGLDLTAVGIGLCAFRYQSVHALFPWSTFLASCSFHMPQVYWEGDYRPLGPVDQLQRSYRELNAIRQLPFIPLGIACLDAGFKPTPEQIANFNGACLKLALPGIGWYEWNAALAQPELYAAVMAANGWTATPAPSPVPGPGPSVSDAVIHQYITNQDAMLADLAEGRQGSYVAWTAG